MKRFAKTCAAFLLIVALPVLAAGCGSDDPESAEAPGNEVDRAFIAAMVPHHESGVAMAEVVDENSENEFVITIAAGIDRNQTAEIADMKRIDEELAAAGIEVGALGSYDHARNMEADTSALTEAPNFDKAFLRHMIVHHEGALGISQLLLEQGSNAELKIIARNIISSQSREIDAMKAELKRLRGGSAGGSGGSNASSDESDAEAEHEDSGDDHGH